MIRGETEPEDQAVEQLFPAVENVASLSRTA
jgi:hypothetical protein